MTAHETFVEIEREFMLHVLRAYSTKGSIYLQSVETIVDKGNLAVRGRFRIASSCYIEDTGHFNAVEFNICYNQMFYLLLADAVRRRGMIELEEWSISTFLDKQLSHVLIIGIENRFKRPIDPKNFWAEGRIDKVKRRADGMVFLETSLEFGDDAKGSASGKVNLAILPIGVASPGV